MRRKIQILALPDSYRFPFDKPDGIVYNRETGDPTPYHRLREDEIVVFIFCHYPRFPSTLQRIDQQTFLEDYVSEYLGE